MISYNEAYAKLEASQPEAYLIKHAKQSQAIMQALAKHLNEDQELWGLVGLLHDYDYPQTANQPQEHGLLSASLLANDLPDTALQAIRAHNSEMNGTVITQKLDYALRASETLSGLLNAASLMRPTGFAGMQVSSIKKKMKDKAFAASVCRENIHECTNLGLDIDIFLALAIEALQ